MKSAAEQYKHQQKYFDREFSEIKRYTLHPWQASYVKRVKRNLLHRNYKGKLLVDVATGGGYMAIEMARLGLKVLACDLSKESIRNLNKYKEDHSLSGLKGKLCRAEQIPLASSSVDYVVANAILEHIPDERTAVAEWLRVLNPKDISKQIIKFLSSKKRLRKYSGNAIRYAGRYDWNEIYSRALIKTFQK